MKTLFKIVFILLLVYFLWSFFIDRKESKIQDALVEQKDGDTITLKGEVISNFSVFNQSMITVKEHNTKKTFYILLTKSDASAVGTSVNLEVRKSDIIRINDRSVTLYKEVS